MVSSGARIAYQKSDPSIGVIRIFEWTLRYSIRNQNQAFSRVPVLVKFRTCAARSGFAFFPNAPLDRNQED